MLFNRRVGTVAAVMFVLSSLVSCGQSQDEVDRPALRLLLLPFKTDCNDILPGSRVDGLRKDLEYQLSAVSGIAAQAISAAGDRDSSEEWLNELVAEFDGNTLARVQLTCGAADRIAFEVLFTSIANDGANAGISGSSDADLLSLRNALQDSILGKMKPGFEQPRPSYDRKAFGLYLDVVNSSSKLSSELRLQFARAATDFDDRLDPAWLHRGLLALKVGEQGGTDAACYFAESDMALREALSIDSALPMAIYGLSSVQMRTGQTEAAAAILRAGLVARPDFALLHSKLGYVNRYAGLMGESVSEYRRSQEIDRSIDNLIEAERQIVKSHIYSGEFASAFASYQKILGWLHMSGRDPDEKMQFYQGVARFYAGEHERAIEYFDGSIATSPGTVWSDFAAAYRAGVTGETGELIRLADELATGNVSDGERRYRLAHLYALGNEPEKALFHLYESARSGFFNYPYTKSDRLLANISDLQEFDSVLQFIKDRHLAYATSASDISILRNTYEKAISHALGLDYSYMLDHSSCPQ